MVGHGQAVHANGHDCRTLPQTRLCKGQDSLFPVQRSFAYLDVSKPQGRACRGSKLGEHSDVGACSGARQRHNLGPTRELPVIDGRNPGRFFTICQEDWLLHRVRRANKHVSFRLNKAICIVSIVTAGRLNFPGNRSWPERSHCCCSPNTLMDADTLATELLCTPVEPPVGDAVSSTELAMSRSLSGCARVS